MQQGSCGEGEIGNCADIADGKNGNRSHRERIGEPGLPSPPSHDYGGHEQGRPEEGHRIAEARPELDDVDDGAQVEMEEGEGGRPPGERVGQDCGDAQQHDDRERRRCSEFTQGRSGKVDEKRLVLRIWPRSRLIRPALRCQKTSWSST